MQGPVLHTDIALIGGGIAGLWTLNQLRASGYSAVLFEHRALGSEQTIASQGMIHGGVKYALSGAWSGGSEIISTMPDTWRAALAGQGKVDLRGCRVLSDDFYLWSNTGLQSRVSTFFASKLLRGRVQKVTGQQRPAPLQDPAFKGQVYRLVDLVLDVPSLLETLVARHADAVFSVDWNSAELQREANQARIRLPHCTVVPQQLILTAGSGNAALMQALAADTPAMQRRPLQQVLVKHEYQEPFYGHCMGSNPSPRLTISSHRTQADEPVWYLGGDLATQGTDSDPAVLIERAREELHGLLPWIDFGHCEWRTIRLDRAEPKQSKLLRPDTAYVGAIEGIDNALVAWPTKLTLSPDLGNAVEKALQERGIQPQHQPDLATLSALGQPPVAKACWDSLFA
tara:strand:- start:266025 stop:267221 length:1197 start_codon:yes stop_codon:yes gene_type:complete